MELTRLLIGDDQFACGQPGSITVSLHEVLIVLQLGFKDPAAKEDDGNQINGFAGRHIRWCAVMSSEETLLGKLN